MDAEALATFLAVHRQQSFSKAAEVLHRTQPAISRRISLLKEELGAPLFERTTSGIVLSQTGRVLLPYAERALAAVQDAENGSRQPHAALRRDAEGRVPQRRGPTIARAPATIVTNRCVMNLVSS